MTVVRVDDWDAAVPRVRESSYQARLPCAKRPEQSVAVLVLEVLEDVDDDQRVVHGGGNIARC